MPLTLLNVPSDMDEIGLTRLARIAYAFREDSHLTNLFLNLQKDFEKADTSPAEESDAIEEIHLLNHQADIAGNLLELFLKVSVELSNQVEEFLDKRGIEMRITPQRKQ